jgi:hypothetical protein
LSEGVGQLVRNKEMRYSKLFARHLVGEIARTNADSFKSDSKSAKYFYTFFTSLSKELPEAFVANMNDLVEHLDGEAYNMRSAVLTSMKEAIKVGDLSSFSRCYTSQLTYQLMISLSQLTISSLSIDQYRLVSRN